MPAGVVVGAKGLELDVVLPNGAGALFVLPKAEFAVAAVLVLPNVGAGAVLGFPNIDVTPGVPAGVVEAPPKMLLEV